MRLKKLHINIIHFFVDIGDISLFSYFKEFERAGDNDPISETGDVYSGTLYQNDNTYQTIQVVEPPKDDKSIKNEQEYIQYSEPIYYFQDSNKNSYPTSAPHKETTSKYEPIPLQEEV